MARGRRTGRKTDYSWQGASGVLTTIGTANQFLVLAIFGAPFTVMRTRGNVVLTMDTGAAGDAMAVGLGIIILKDSVVTAGAASMPGPSNVLDAEWVWHQWVPLLSQTGTQSDDVGGQVARVEIDSKAMRKVKSNEQIVFVADAIIHAGTPTVDLVVGGRILVGD